MFAPDVLNKNSDFRRLYGRGKSAVHPVLVTYSMKNRGHKLRFGITAGKKVGNAVLRNRARRIIREAFRQLSEEVVPGYDIVFVARAKTAHVKMTNVLPVMRSQLKTLGALKEKDID